MESTENVGDREISSSKVTNGSSVDLPNLGLKMALNVSRVARECPECGSESLDTCKDSKGEAFLLCLSCINLFPENR